MYRALHNDKIGNVLRYFSQHIKYLPSMKAIKLLFLLDERAVKETGTPVTWLEYKAWKFGPVPVAIWAEFRYSTAQTDDNPECCTLSDYVDIHRFDNEEFGSIEIQIVAKGAFDDDEFSAYELHLLGEIVKEYGGMSGSQLSHLTHRAGSPWQKAVSAFHLEHRFELGDLTPDVVVDLAGEIDSDAKFQAYLAAKESMNSQLQFLQLGKSHGHNPQSH